MKQQNTLKVDKIQPLFSHSGIKIFEKPARKEAFCRAEIVFESVVTVNISYMDENQSQDIQTQPGKLQWTLVVKDD